MTTQIKELEIESAFMIKDGKFEAMPLLPGTAPALGAACPSPTLSLTAESTYPTANIRVPLQQGDADKASLLLNGEISRVDPETADRITQLILEKAAETLLAISTDYRRQGLFILPFRLFTMVMLPDGTLSYPSAQAIALPTDFSPHPEITASSVTADCLTLALRFPTRPHRLNATLPANMPAGYSLRTFISYPLYIPSPKEIRGSIGSVRSATGGNATGIRFAFLSTSSLKASVAAPEKYYELIGNQRTGYHIASKAAKLPDYSVYASLYGFTQPFPSAAMLIKGAGISDATDPLDWIADWGKTGDGYLPTALPYIYRIGQTDTTSPEANNDTILPQGIDKDEVMALAGKLGMSHLLLTHPFGNTPSSKNSHKTEPMAIRAMQLQGLPASTCVAILYGSHDCCNWHPLCSFNPHTQHFLMSPPRLWHRILLIGAFNLAETCLQQKILLSSALILNSNNYQL